MHHKYLRILVPGLLILGMTAFVAAASAQKAVPEYPSPATSTDTQTSIPQNKVPASSINDVRNAQIALKNRGYDPGEINGLMSSETHAAIKKFQEANNLPLTGNLDERTQALLVPVPDKGPGENGRMKPGDVPSGRLGNDLRQRISNSAAILHESVASPDRRIPDALMQKADAIMVIPHMVKGAFGVGGTYGKGMVVRRHANGSWSAPLFVSIGGGNFGAQLGVSSTDLVLVFTDGRALKPLEDGSSFKLGIDAAVVAGPMGRELQAGTTMHLNSGIYAYSHAKGAFAGVALDGAVLDLDKEANAAVYGSSADAHQILTSESAVGVEMPFMDALEHATAQRKTTER